MDRSTNIPVRPKAWVSFQCNRCSACCCNIEDQLNLSPLEAYRIASFFCKQGTNMSVRDVYDKYAHLHIVEKLLPLFVMNTDGPNNSCVFLQDGRCSIYDARPTTCRIYPFFAVPGVRGRKWEIFQCFDRHAVHFSDGKILVKDWMFQNFKKEDQKFMIMEAEFMPKFGQMMRKFGDKWLNKNITKILGAIYFDYDLTLPFLAQYAKNTEMVLYMGGGESNETQA